jgi:hypothetical protein
MSAMSAPAQ